MSQAYTPALEVTPRTRVRKIRELPIPGEALVTPGSYVEANTSVLAAKLPGDLEIVRIASRMELDPEDVIPGIRVKEGDQIRKGQILCEVKTFFGLFTNKLQSPSEGIVEFFTQANAHLGVRGESIPLTVNAYLSGFVTEVKKGKSVTIETEATLIQGIFGVGGERHGEVLVLPVPTDETLTGEKLLDLEVDLKNKILIGGSQFDISALREAAKQGAQAVITGSIDAEVLRDFVGFEIGVSITGDEDIPLTLIVTEGFGNLPLSERIIKLAKEVEGASASVNGATQVRAGAMRPEVIVPLKTEKGNSPEALLKTLSIGSKIRVIRVPYFGSLGKVTELPKDPERIPTGAKVRVLRAKLDSGKTVTIPRANVELV